MNDRYVEIKKEGKNDFSIVFTPPLSHYFVRKIEVVLSLEQLKQLRDEIDEAIGATNQSDKHQTETSSQTIPTQPQ